MNAEEFMQLKGICTKCMKKAYTFTVEELKLFLEEYSKIATFYPFIRNKKKKE